MSRTLGRHAARRRPAGDYRTVCDECGADELRSKLRRLPSGLLVHRGSESRGRDALTLDRLNANATIPRRPPPREGGNR